MLLSCPLTDSSLPPIHYLSLTSEKNSTQTHCSCLGGLSREDVEGRERMCYCSWDANTGVTLVESGLMKAGSLSKRRLCTEFTNKVSCLTAQRSQEVVGGWLLK